jgi:hypothetical protein
LVFRQISGGATKESIEYYDDLMKQNSINTGKNKIWKCNCLETITQPNIYVLEGGVSNHV